MEVIGTVGIVVPSDQTGVSSIYCWTVFAAVGFTAWRRDWCTQKSNSILETLSTHNGFALQKPKDKEASVCSNSGYSGLSLSSEAGPGSMGGKANPSVFRASRTSARLFMFHATAWMSGAKAVTKVSIEPTIS